MKIPKKTRPFIQLITDYPILAPVIRKGKIILTNSFNQ